MNWLGHILGLDKPRCWRVGKFPHGQYHYCRVHHPDDHPGRIEVGGEFE